MARTFYLALTLTIGIVCGVAATTQEIKPQATPPATLAWQQLYVQSVPNRLTLITFRARVPGGWLVAVLGQMEQIGQPTMRPGEIPVGATFLPDPDHRWETALAR